MYGVWGQLENAVFDQAKIKDLKVSVMAGPYLMRVIPYTEV